MWRRAQISNIKLECPTNVQWPGLGNSRNFGCSGQRASLCACTLGMARPDIVRMVRMVSSEPVVLCRGECEPSEVTELDTRPDICNTFSIFIKTKVNTSGGPHQHSKQSQNLKHLTLPSKHFMFVKKLSQCQCTQHSVLVSSQFFLT